MKSIFREGGEHNIRKTGLDQYSLTVSIPSDSDGLTGRECPSKTCSPGYFKVKGGTGMTEQSHAFCPYCRHADDPSNFVTEQQKNFARDIAMREAHRGIQEMIGDALGLGASGNKKFGGPFFSMELSYKPGALPHVSRPAEEELRRDIVCPNCGLAHAVYGLAIWCADCGQDIFISHVTKELSVIQQMLSDVDRRRAELGNRVAARDLENALEDTVSVFEAVLRAIMRRRMNEDGRTQGEIEQMMKKIGNRLQNIQLASEIFKEMLGTELLGGFDEGSIKCLKATFEKRHPITHNLGVVDRIYLEKVRSCELEGREVRVTSGEIKWVVGFVIEILTGIHSRLFSEGPKKAAS